MRDPRTILTGDRGWRPAVRFRGAKLLNQGWHKLRSGSDLPRCPVCDAELVAGDHGVHQGGEIFHPDCLLYRWRRA